MIMIRSPTMITVSMLKWIKIAIPLSCHWRCAHFRTHMMMEVVTLSYQLVSLRLRFVDSAFTFFFLFTNIYFELGMVLSVIFIIATLTVYGCIPKLRNLNGRCLMRYLTVLAIGFTLIACVQINGWHRIHPVLCQTIGYLTYFTFVSAFSWLNVINFDLWLNSKMIVLKTGQNEQTMNPFLNW